LPRYFRRLPVCCCLFFTRCTRLGLLFALLGGCFGLAFILCGTLRLTILRAGVLSKTARLSGRRLRCLLCGITKRIINTALIRV
jgi:hypothetical protein